MSKNLFLFSLLLPAIFLTSKSQAVIFGENNIQEVGRNPKAAVLGRSVAIMVGDVYLLPQPDKTFDLDFILASEPGNIGLCKEEKFSNQYTAWVNCSGFLVAPDIMVTAGHCMSFGMETIQNVATPICQNFKWIFDYQNDANGKVNLSHVDPNNIYSCTNVIYMEHLAFTYDHLSGAFISPPGGKYGTDFAVIKLDRPVIGRDPLVIAKTPVKKGDAISALGYPMALPLKYTDKAKVLDASFDDYILTDLDILGGSSGGPAFNDKNEVVGIVVRNFPYEDMEYHKSRDCSTLTVCRDIGKGTCVTDDPNDVLGTHIDRIVHAEKWIPR